MKFTPKQIREAFSYDPETGVISRKPKLGSRSKLGPCPTGISNIGYQRVSLYSHVMTAHRVAFCVMTGRWPKRDIDHIHGDRADNRWRNLRECTRQQNVWNGKARSPRSGWKGAYFQAGRYMARIKKDGKGIYLGRFDTAEEAHAAYLAAAKDLFGEFARAA
jgi:hypothetical protein